MTRLTHREMADNFAGQARSKAKWLMDFSTGRNKRPDHELEQRRADLRALEQAAGDYERAAERSAA